MSEPRGPFVPSAQPASDGRVLAGFGDRFLARAIDTLIVGVAGVVLGFVAVAIYLALAHPHVSDTSTGTDSAALTAVSEVAVLWFVLLVAATYLYDVELMYRRGQTVGKRAMGIRIVPASPDRPLTRRSATMRWLVEDVASFVVPYFGLLDGLWLLWDKPLRQCLHDKAARTIVIRA